MSRSLSCLTDYHLTLLKWIPMLVMGSWICICEGQGDDQLKGLSHKDNGLKACMHNFGFLKSTFQKIDMFQWSTCGSPTRRATSRSECVSEDNLGSPSTAARTLWVSFIMTDKTQPEQVVGIISLNWSISLTSSHLTGISGHRQPASQLMLVMILRSADIDVTGVSGHGQLASWLGKGSRGILCWGAEVDKLSIF